MKKDTIRINLEQVPKTLVSLRKNRNLTQIELAKKIQTGQAAISRIENGKDSVSIRLIQRLADALGYKLEIHFYS